MFVVPALAALANARQTTGQDSEESLRLPLNRVYWLVIVIVTLLIGLRYQVGGDWFNYARNLERISYLPP